MERFYWQGGPLYAKKQGSGALCAGKQAKFIAFQALKR
jgi:hypothetical protein